MSTNHGVGEVSGTPGATPNEASSPTSPNNVRKERLTVIWVDFGGDQTLSGMSAPNERGELTFYDENGHPVAPKRVEIGTAYERAKGMKVITRAEADPADILLDVNRQLSRFAYVFAVDTNTKAIGAEEVSVTSIVLLRDIVVANGRWTATPIVQSLLEARDVTVRPERLGWRHLMWLIAKNGLVGSIAVFVDSELQLLTALNKREAELLPGFLLPDNITLFYGSSDAGRVEFIGNKAIAECDRHARALFKRIEAGESIGDFLSNVRYCSRYRLWPPPD